MTLILIQYGNPKLFFLYIIQPQTFKTGLVILGKWFQRAIL